MNRQIWLLIICLMAVSTPVMATVYAPDPSAPLSVLWDTMLGSGSFNSWSTGLRRIPQLTVFFIAGWIAFGLYKAFVGGKIEVTDLVTYSGRLLLIVVVAITLLRT